MTALTFLQMYTLFRKSSIIFSHNCGFDFCDFANNTSDIVLEFLNRLWSIGVDLFTYPKENNLTRRCFITIKSSTNFTNCFREIFIVFYNFFIFVNHTFFGCQLLITNNNFISNRLEMKMKSLNGKSCIYYVRNYLGKRLEISIRLPHEF